MSGSQAVWSTVDQVLQKIDLARIEDEPARECIRLLLNLVETLSAELRKAQAENLYGRQQPPRRPGGGGQPGPPRESSSRAQRSSEKERAEPAERERLKRPKLDRIRVDREEVLKLDRALLPPDAQFKGYEEVVVQDLRISTDNVRFRKEKYYAASTGRTYLAPLPPGYEGEYGPNVKSLCLVFSHLGNMTEPKIADVLGNVGTLISDGQISRLLARAYEPFQEEKEAIVEAGLSSSPWQHLDDTGTRVEGRSWHCHVLCNPLYTAYSTTPRKDRLTVIDVLRNQRERVFRLNEEALGLLGQLGVTKGVLARVRPLACEEDWKEAELNRRLAEEFPHLGRGSHGRILEAAAIAAYHAQVGYPVVRLLVCDDAKQFKLVTEELALCWVHDGRHYQSLEPCVPQHRQWLEAFRKRYWDYYRQLRAYQRAPTPEWAEQLRDQFDALFSTLTGYEGLDERIAKTRANKANLLQVLEHPEIPLHNNPAELGARLRVRKRVVSYGPRSDLGVKAWDAMETVIATAKKLGVSCFQYIGDRVSEARKIPSLAELIRERAKTLNLGSSWATPIRSPVY